MVSTEFRKCFAVSGLRLACGARGPFPCLNKPGLSFLQLLVIQPQNRLRPYKEDGSGWLRCECGMQGCCEHRNMILCFRIHAGKTGSI